MAKSAKKPKPKKRAGKKAGAKKTNTGKTRAKKQSRQDILRAVFDALSSHKARWQDYPHIRVGGIDAMQMRAYFPDKAALLSAYFEETGVKAAAAYRKAGPDGNLRDRLFDYLMTHLDVMERDRAALRGIARDKSCLPVMLQSLFRLSPQWAATVSPREDRMAVCALRGLLMLGYPGLLLFWLQDESRDRAKTMAALDRSLEKLEAAYRAFASVKDIRAHQKRRSV